MLLIKLITVLAAAAGLVVFAHVRTRSTDDVKVDEIIGKWYTIALANPLEFSTGLSCDQRNMIKGNHDDCINVTGNALYNGSTFSYEGTGKITDSDAKMEYPEHNLKTLFHLKSFNNGNEMIWHDKGDGKHHALISRTSTASSETKEKFEKDAKDDNVKVFYMSQDNCS